MNSDGWSAKSSRVIDGLDAGQRLGLRRVDRDDARVRVRAAQHAADELAGQVEVGAEAGAARDLVDAVRADRARADVAPARSCRSSCRSRPWLSLSHRGGGVHHRADDLVVAGAPAEVAGQPVADLGLGRVRDSSRAAPCRPRGSPGVQMPHCSAACSRNFCCSGWSVSPLAMPSIVSIRRPPTSQPSTRHEQTSRPSSMTLQAPQSPEAQPSLLPVRLQRVAEHVEQRLLRLAEELDRVAVHRRLDVVLGHQRVLARSSAIRAARRASTPATWMRNSMVPRLSSIGRHAARAAASSRSCAGLVEPAADDGLRPPPPPAAPARATAPSDTRAAVIVPAAVDGQAHARAHHGDVHLRARDEAQVGVARARRPRRQQERDDDLALGRARACAGPSITSSTGRSRRPLGPARVATAPAAMSAGTLSAAGEPLHRLPPRVARPWTWVEPMRLAASTTPGHTCLSRGCSLSSAPVTAAPIAPAALLLGDRPGLGDLLDVDDQLGVDDVGAHLDQQVGAPGQHPRLARAPPPAGRPPPPVTPGLLPAPASADMIPAPGHSVARARLSRSARSAGALSAQGGAAPGSARVSGAVSPVAWT